MANSKHTPGPWALDPCGDVLGNRNTKDDNGLVCTMCSDRNDEEGRANARLIAAAPDLLAVCRDIQAFLKRSGYDTTLVNAAIAKAEGR